MQMDRLSFCSLVHPKSLEMTESPLGSNRGLAPSSERFWLMGPTVPSGLDAEAGL